MDGRQGRDMRATTSEDPPERRSRMTLGRDGRMILTRNSSPRVCADGRVQVHQYAATHRGTVTVRGHQPPEPTKHTAGRPPRHTPPPAFRQILRCSLLPPAGPSAGRCSFPDMTLQGSAADARSDVGGQVNGATPEARRSRRARGPCAAGSDTGLAADGDERLRRALVDVREVLVNGPSQNDGVDQGRIPPASAEGRRGTAPRPGDATGRGGVPCRSGGRLGGSTGR